MKTNTSKLTFSAVLAAAVVAFVYITTIWGTLQIVSAAISTFAVMLTLKICGRKFALAHYTAVSVILFMLLANKFYAAGYFIFFGLYAIVKSFIEQKNNIAKEWLFKIVYFAVISALFIAGFILFASQGFKITIFLYISIFFAAIAIMVAYDVFLSVFGNQLFMIAEKFLKNIKQ